jgi:internalin A
MTIPQWVLVRIQEAKDRNSDTLNLRYISGDPLTEIPHNLFYPYKWQKLSLSNNDLINLPKSIAQLQDLTILDLSDNQLIEIPWVVTKLRTLKMLDLEGNRLSSLPESIVNLQDLTILNLSKNEFASLPDFIAELQNLTTLNLDENKLASLPESIAKLQNLTELWLGSNDLTSLPEDIAQLQNMTKLDLSKNKITKLPDSLAKLQKLTRLNLQSNRLTSLPESITALHNLTTLILKDNPLTSLPESIGDLRHLEVLDLSVNAAPSVKSSTNKPQSPYLKTRTAILVKRENENAAPSVKSSITEPESSYLKMRTEVLAKKESKEFRENQLTKLPESIGDLKNLVFLNLSNNKFTSLPKSIAKLENLTELNLTANPLATPPPEVAAKGIEGIREYFRQLEEQGQDQLYEAKLLILGESGAGKTTLAKKIEDPNYLLQDEKSTPGVDVSTWSFPIEGGKSFRVNIWDFGGQEIYHATHQFFLTKRSLYALVADTRKEDTDFYYWLNVVDLLSDNSPILIIKNEKQDRHRELNERQLRGEFENLKEVLAVNLSTNRGLDKLMAEIEHYIKNLPHIGSPLPKTWIRVRERLENDYRNFISVEEYLDISKKNGFTQIKDCLQLSEYLHDIGVFLHFQDEPLLSKTVILKPKWGTDAVYKVLDNKTVIKNLGRFTRADLNTIWDVPEYENMRNELLQLMMKFKLCYEIPTQKGTYVAPQLLTENQPEYKWDDEENLLLRYTYEFMPKGILLQLIVVMSDYIWRETVWKSGVLLEKDRTRAQVIEYYGKREIQIRVVGSHKKELMTIIIHELDRIHETYKRLKFDKLIPCNCKDCKANNEPHFYKYEQLQNFIEKHIFEIQCGITGNMVQVRRLIDDIIGYKSDREVEELMAKQKRLTSGSINVGDNFSGTIITGTVKNSFNKIESSTASNELKETLKRLVQAVETMSEALPDEEATEVKDDLDKLVEEATKENPKQRWYSVSIDGLTKAAENLGKVGEPVIELSQKILSLLTIDTTK